MMKVGTKGEQKIHDKLLSAGYFLKEGANSSTVELRAAPDIKGSCPRRYRWLWQSSRPWKLPKRSWLRYPR